MTQEEMSNSLEPIPEVGKEYHFWDDGKKSPGRHYICRCERVIPYKEAKNIKFTLKDYHYPYTEDSEYEEYDTNLKDIWKQAVKDHSWVYSEDTDYFVEVSCPAYDENNLWAARTKNGGWFTLNIQSDWQGGDIDVTGKAFQDTVSFYKEMVEEYEKKTY